MNAAGALRTIAQGTNVLLALAMLLTLVRLVKGPTTPDRVVALDLMAIIAVGMVAVQTVLTGEFLLLRPATVLALVGFLATVAVARFLERSHGQWRS